MDMPMNLTDQRYTDLIAAFDNWRDYHSICQTLIHVGLECAETEAEYHRKIDKLYAARFSYPDLPLHEAFAVIERNGVIVPVTRNITVVTPQVNAPCGVCGGGAVR